MPIFEHEIDRETMTRLAETNRCGECKSGLTVAWGGSFGYDGYILRCFRHIDHRSLERPYSPGPYDIPGFNLFNLNKGRRKRMTQEFGEEKTKALEKYAGIGTITKAVATEIVNTLWGKAPLIEKTKAIILCQSYQLNPLMRHLYLIPYKRKDKKGNYILDEQGNYALDWSMQIGIGATRLLAQRKHNFSYLDLTPRKATVEEINKILGDTADPDSIYGFVWIKDQDTGAEAFGLRGIPKNASIKGADKGNTHLNQACVRAERLALDRQYPGEMPPANVEVVDERFMDADYRIVDKETGEITDLIAEEPEPAPAAAAPKPKEHWCEEHNCKFDKKRSRFGEFYAHKAPDGTWCNEAKKKDKLPGTTTVIPTPQPALIPEDAPPAEQDTRGVFEQEGRSLLDEALQPSQPAPAEEAKGLIDMDWLKESLKTIRTKNIEGWEESKLFSYMKGVYKVEGETTLEMAAKLDKGQSIHFINKIQEALAKASATQ